MPAKSVLLPPLDDPPVNPFDSINGIDISWLVTRTHICVITFVLLVIAINAVSSCFTHIKLNHR